MRPMWLAERPHDLKLTVPRRQSLGTPTSPPGLPGRLTPTNLGCLTGDSFTSMSASHKCRPPLVWRPRRHAAFQAVRAVLPRFVHKSVHKPRDQSHPPANTPQAHATTAIEEFGRAPRSTEILAELEYHATQKLINRGERPDAAAARA